MQLIYLASPYTHRSVAVRRQRYRFARMAAAEFMERGLHVYAPVVHGHAIWESMNKAMEPSHDFWVSTGLDFLRRCDELYVLCLPGFKDSAGVTAEVHAAMEQRKKITMWDYKPLEPILEQHYLDTLYACQTNWPPRREDHDSGGGAR